MPEPTNTPTTPLVVSAVQPRALTEAERKQRYNQLRERFGKSRLEVKGKPGIHYFWAHKPDDSELIRLQSMGYWIVKEPNAAKVLKGEVKPEIEASGLKEDGTYVIGDVILVACEQELYDFLQLDHTQQMEEMKRAAKEDFITEAEAVGAPTFEVERKEKKPTQRR